MMLITLGIIHLIIGLILSVLIFRNFVLELDDLKFIEALLIFISLCINIISWPVTLFFFFVLVYILGLN